MRWEQMYDRESGDGRPCMTSRERSDCDWQAKDAEANQSPVQKTYRGCMMLHARIED